MTYIQNNQYKIILDNTFDNKYDAQDYIIRKNMSKIIHHMCPPTEKFCREYSFGDNEWFYHRNYFLNYPNFFLISNILKKNGYILLK